MTFKRVNNITGWIVCFIACTVYVMTMEATGSFWDCGEFISSTFKMQIPHPPGAPLFVMLGRLFIVAFSWIFGSGPESAARSVNFMTAMASGFTILFLFWTITHFARKIVITNNSVEPTKDQLFSIMAAGTVGALAYTFSDSFWFSAVEGEVYGMSSLFTALVFWAILKWEHNADNPGSDKWIIFIFFLMGLSIGVHLLGLLTIPAIVMVYYFKRYKTTLWGTIWAFLIGCAITGFVQKFVIQETVAGAGKFDIWFVNSLNMPFFSGFIFFFVLLAIIFYFGLRIAKKNNWSFLTLGIWSIVFMLLGYSTYVTTMIRSNANPAVDMYNVDNPNSLVGYLGRDQYGDFPLIYGQVFTADVGRDANGNPTYDEGDMKYTKGKDANGKNKYIEIGRDSKPIYNSEDMMFFPRVWDASQDQNHADYYGQWLGIGKYNDKQSGQVKWERNPNQLDNINFFIGYQINWMYLRYFMWNFAGKQNDLQGTAPGDVRDGNWLSGISFIDNLRLGDQSKMPASIKHNKANNTLFFLPLILGVIGMVFHYFKNKQDFLVAGLLFFFTGLAIVLYLNQAGNQPRERDYAYVGSFYAFAIWIGLGVLQVKEWFQNKLSANVSGIISFAVCMLAVPVLMGQQEWDDHDRSKKVLARDLAKDYLESCAPNAILFTYGDNDTYPLWYAQEVEHIRPDIRVINNSLLGIDWYINQLRYKVNESDPIDVIWDENKIQGNNRNYAYINPRQDLSQETYYDAYLIMKDFVGSDDADKKLGSQGADGPNYLPTRRMKLPVDEKTVRANGTVNPADTVAPEVDFELAKNKSILFKNDLAILNIIAANKWKRPIYFTAPNTGQELGLSNYLRKDGLTYRLVPVLNNTGLNTEWVVDKLIHKFGFGSANFKGVYFDEQNRVHLNSIRQTYADGASGMADMGKKEEAIKLLNMADKGILEENMPYAMVSHGNQHNYFTLRYLEACYKSGYTKMADHVSKALHKDLDEQVKYVQSLSESKQESMAGEAQSTQQMIQLLASLENQYKGGPIGNAELEKIISSGKDSGTKKK
jgi:Protein of unknown function (DUF2723)